MTTRSLPTSPVPSGPLVVRRLIGAYFVASVVATVGGAALFGFGLDFTPRQVAIGLLVLAPLAVIVATWLDVWVLRAAFRPVDAFLRALPAPERGSQVTAVDALVRAINLPVLTLLRVLSVHGPSAAVTITLAALALNWLIAFGLGASQLVVLWLLIAFVSVGHAFMEYFLVADVMRPVVHRIHTHVPELTPDQRRRIIPVPMRRTLFAVSFFVVFVPLLFLGVSLLAKVTHLLGALGAPHVGGTVLRLYAWVGLIIAMSMAIVLLMSAMTSREVMRAADEMAAAMDRVERNEFDEQLVVTTASEFSALYEGFNRMSGRLRELIDYREQRVAQETEQKSREHFRSLVENGSDLILVLASDGTIAYESPAVSRVLGFPPGRLPGRKLGELVHPEDAQAFASSLAGGADGRGAERAVELRASHATEGWRTLEAIVKPATAMNGDRTFIVNARDVTDRKREEAARQELESRLVQWQKMESIGRLAGGIAHDFNNLLAIISGRCQILMRSRAEAGALRRSLDIVLSASEKGAMLTRQLLAFSRKQVVQTEVLELDAVLREAMALVSRVLREDIQLVFRPDAPGGGVRADRGQLTQVMLNLSTNARDAMPRGGVLTIATGETDVGDAEAGRHPGIRAGRFLTLSVHDTGVGMDKDLRALIFEPFFTTKGIGRGTGLGLATVYGIVAQGGGFVTVDGAPGAGSTFTVHLPRVELAQEPRPGSSAIPSRAGAESILLVEDEHEVRSVVRELLEEEGYRVLEAPGGPEAVEVAERHPGPIHLLLTDVVMPLMSGRQLADLLGAQRPGLRVLFMSGHTDDALGPHGVTGDSRGFIQKPFLLEDLARRVRDCLEPPQARVA